MSEDLRASLSAALPEAMRGRDRVAVAALRSALAAVANAEAVPVGHGPRAGALEQALLGAGAADAPRRELTPGDVRAIVHLEVREREEAAQTVQAAGRPDEAERLLAEADVLRRHLGS